MIEYKPELIEELGGLEVMRGMGKDWIEKIEKTLIPHEAIYPKLFAKVRYKGRKCIIVGIDQGSRKITRLLEYPGVLCKYTKEARISEEEEKEGWKIPSVFEASRIMMDFNNEVYDNNTPCRTLPGLKKHMIVKGYKKSYCYLYFTAYRGWIDLKRRRRGLGYAYIKHKPEEFYKRLIIDL